MSGEPGKWALVGYCPECGGINNDPLNKRTCCPDSRVYRVPYEVAVQAKEGFRSRLQEASAVRVVQVRINNAIVFDTGDLSQRWPDA